MNLKERIREKIVIMDGAMGTMIQEHDLKESDFRGKRFENHTCELAGNHDLLSLTRPQLVKDIHHQYLEAGADIIETNTFNANAVSMSDYELEDWVTEMNRDSALIAKEAVREISTRKKPAFVAGVIGPTNKTASISPDMNDPADRDIDFDTLVEVYLQQAKGLLDGGVDMFLIETIFDPLNAKAALYALEKCNKQNLPVVVSVTIADNQGRTFTGQAIEAFLDAISHHKIFSVGINCSFGAKQILPVLRRVSKKTSLAVNSHPNAGLPNELGDYEQSAREMASEIESFFSEGLINIIGGCCGSRPEHIKAIADKAAKYSPRKISPGPEKISLSGLEVLNIKEEEQYIKVGERTNVMGSKKFARLILQEKYDEALAVARHQAEQGAHVLNVNLDEALIDTRRMMKKFLNLLSSEPDLARLPVMIDSSRFEVLIEGLKTLQGKSVVNSISLKEGEEDFLKKATEIRKFGAAIVVMAFDENGQADTFERKIEICQRSYYLLRNTLNVPPEEIIFDPNVLTIGTGIEEHANYAVEFIEAARWLKAKFPDAKVTGGISNVSFAFRGNPAVRQAMNSVFLHHAVKAGLDMVIINPAKIMEYEEIPNELRNAVEDVLLNRDKEATENLLEISLHYSEKQTSNKGNKKWRKKSAEERVKDALIYGNSDYLYQDLDDLEEEYSETLQIIDGPLMESMDEVGRMFGEGELFLPQVVKSARVMKKAVNYIMPRLQEENNKHTKTTKGKVVLATAKGDVHDIGKNILALVLRCNNYEVIDLGVMVENETIIRSIKNENPDVVGVSGLITPSLDYMESLAVAMEKNHLTVPLMLGGAATSEKHTAIKVAPKYSGLTLYGGDASRTVNIINQLVIRQTKTFGHKTRERQDFIRRNYQRRKFSSGQYVPILEARDYSFSPDYGYLNQPPKMIGIKTFDEFPLQNLRDYIDWTPFFHGWGMKGKYPEILYSGKKGEEAKRIYQEANELLDRIIENDLVTAKGVFGLFPANASGDDILIYEDEKRQSVREVLPMLRQQKAGRNSEGFWSLSDFVAPIESQTPDYIGAFAVSAGIDSDYYVNEFKQQGDHYNSIMFRLVCDRLTEAFAERLHEKVRKEYWGYQSGEQLSMNELIKEKFPGIRPAPGYPACPDHTLKGKIFELLNATRNTGIKLTSSYAMHPASAVSGFYFAHPQAKYFGIGKIDEDQVEDYAKRMGWSLSEAEKWLAPQLGYKAGVKV